MTVRGDSAITLVPVLRSGVLAQDFCTRVVHARVEAVFARSLYLRAEDSFICIGEPNIGCGPVTLTASSLSGLDLRPDMSASVSDRHITIENSTRFILDTSEPWRPPGWPAAPPPVRLIETCARLARRAATDAPEEGLARHLGGRPEASGRGLLLARVAGTRIAGFERSLADLAFADAVRGLIGLGPGLTPSGDDFLSGALATLDAIGESGTHARLSHVISDALPGSTSQLSAFLLQAVAAGHVGEHLHRIVASVITADVATALNSAAAIGHSSGWDMLAGAISTLRTIATARVAARHAPAA